MSGDGRLSSWRRLVSDPADWFSAEELARARDYQRPLKTLRLTRLVLGALTLGLLVAGEVPRRLLEALDVRGLFAELLVVVLLVEFAVLLWAPALDWWVEMVHDRRWGLSTMTPRLFFADLARSFALSVVLEVVLLLPLYALARTTSLWWLYAWLVFIAFTVAVGFLFPVVVAPLFNKFSPLADEDLAARIDGVAEAAGVHISDVRVADESRRSRRDNAYVAGLGATRRVVLYDTLLEHPPDVVVQVVAHEIGHWRLGHLRRQIPLLAVLTFGLFGGLRLLADAEGLLDAVGVAGVGDPAGLPLLLLFGQLGFAAVGLVNAWVARAFERQADLEALRVLRRPELAIEMLRRVHVHNLADLDPPWIRRLQASHPPAAERMELAARWASAHGLTGSWRTAGRTMS